VRNPWLDLPSQPPYVVPVDAPFIEVFNRSASRDARVRTELFPEPFIGPLNAPIVMLLLNPGVSRGDFAVHRHPVFRRNIRECLREPRGVRVHQYLTGETPGPGTQWWTRIAGPLIRATTAARVAKSVLAIEFFPYHSVSYQHAMLRLPSQAFTFEMVRRALQREAVIILGRGEPGWIGAVPELARYPLLSRLRNVRNSVISAANLSKPSIFPEICARIRDQRTA
jgi:hypothetical protein